VSEMFDTTLSPFLCCNTLPMCMCLCPNMLHHPTGARIRSDVAGGRSGQLPRPMGERRKGRLWSIKISRRRALLQGGSGAAHLVSFALVAFAGVLTVAILFHSSTIAIHDSTALQNSPLICPRLLRFVYRKMPSMFSSHLIFSLFLRFTFILSSDFGPLGGTRTLTRSHAPTGRVRQRSPGRVRSAVAGRWYSSATCSGASSQRQSQ